MAVVVGLDIGSEAVRAAAVEAKGSLPALRRFGEFPLPAGAVVAGSIVDEEAVGEAMAGLWKRHHLPRKRVVAGIGGPEVAVCRVEIPAPAENELAESLPGLVRDRLPMPVEEAVLDYVPLAETVTAEGGPGLALLVVAVPRAMVETLLRITRRTGLEVMSVDLAVFGLVRGAFGAAPAPEAGRSRGLLDIGATLTQLAVVRDGVTCFVRHLPTGGARFTDSLAAGAGLGREEAEERKRAIGVVPAGLPAGDEEPARLARLLTREADGLISEVRSAVGEYLTEVGEGSLGSLAVAGNGARLPHLANRLGRGLGIRVEPARVLDHITVGRTGLSESQLLALQPVLPAAVGLALWGSFGSPPARRPASGPQAGPPGE